MVALVLASTKFHGSAARLRHPHALWHRLAYPTPVLPKGSSGQTDGKEKDRALMTQKARKAGSHCGHASSQTLSERTSKINRSIRL